MPKILNRTELLVLQGHTIRILEEYQDNKFTMHMSEYNLISTDLRTRLTNYERLLADPSDSPVYKNDAFETEMNILRDSKTRLEKLSKQPNKGGLFQMQDTDEVFPLTYNPKHEIIVFIVLVIVAIAGCVWVV